MLQKSGVPLPVCMCMQGKGLQLGNAQWTARQSNGGFSVTSFWPALNPERVDFKPTMQGVRKKKQRRRRKAKTQPKKDNQEAAVAHHVEERASANSSDVGVIPIAAHHPAVVDLTTCDSVSYEMRDDVPGVKYTKSGTEDWTPVISYEVSKDLKQLNLLIPVVDVSCSRKVELCAICDGVP